MPPGSKSSVPSLSLPTRTTVPSFTYSLSGQRLPQFTWQPDQCVLSYSNAAGVASAAPSSLAFSSPCGEQPVSATPAPTRPDHARNERRLIPGARWVALLVS